MRLVWRLFLESVSFALQSLMANRLRTLLSLLGVTIGILAIVAVFTMVDALEKNVRTSISSLGDDLVFVQKWPMSFGADYPWWKYFNRPEATSQECDELKERLQLAEAASFKVEFSRTLSHSSNSVERTKVIAASHDYDQVRNFEIERGRYFTNAESSNGRAVVVIGSLLAEQLFGPIEPIGKEIKIDGWKASVIGVFKKEGENIFDFSTDEVALIPLTYARNFIDLKRGQNGPMIIVKAHEEVSTDALVDEMTGALRAIRRLPPAADDSFALNRTSILSKGFDSVFSVMNMAGFYIGLFSVLVGGFGIANIMFVSVRERTNQVGIQKALGAKNSFILFQFLSEAVILCIIGGIIGLFMVFLLTIGANIATEYEFTLSLVNILRGLGISTVIGLLSGILPAAMASQMDPVAAIRS
ncbi:MAG: ABC transporter permease [Salibacteraceae bacterium]